MTILICQEMRANQKPTPPSGWKIRIDSMDINELTGSVIGAAIEVHKTLGPGLLESIYEECLCRELELREISYERQKEIPIEYKGSKLDCSYRIDILVANKLILEIKACEVIQGVHEAQLLLGRAYYSLHQSQ